MSRSPVVSSPPNNQTRTSVGTGAQGQVLFLALCRHALERTRGADLYVTLFLPLIAHAHFRRSIAGEDPSALARLASFRSNVTKAVAP